MVIVGLDDHISPFQRTVLFCSVVLLLYSILTHTPKAHTLGGMRCPSQVLLSHIPKITKGQVDNCSRLDISALHT